MAKNTKAGVKKRGEKIYWKQMIPLYLLMLPGLTYMICNNYLPMFGISIAFKKLDVRKFHEHAIDPGVNVSVRGVEAG